MFIRPHEGLFGLREWIEQGVPFQVRACNWQALAAWLRGALPWASPGCCGSNPRRSQASNSQRLGPANSNK